MSEERRKRQQARLGQDQPTTFPVLKVSVIVAILLLIAGGLYLGRSRRTSQLDAFAQCLGTKNAKMYGAYWCPHCAEQKELFGSAFDYAPYTECGIKGSRAMQQVCIDAGVKRFPTWVFADGTRVEGQQQLTFLSEKTGCPLP